tara:strand:+ start:210 stop:500 length:291 start_codon:yes stop_codon:yes gene_type:complete
LRNNNYIIWATHDGLFPFFPSSHFTFAVGSLPLIMPVTKKISSDGFVCEMCKESTFHGKRYIYETFAKSEELIICKKCAIREYGSKHKKNFDEIFK